MAQLQEGASSRQNTMYRAINTAGVITSDITSSQHEVLWYNEFFFNNGNNNVYSKIFNLSR